MNKYILKNGIILDGSEDMKPYKADILVNNGIIEDIITDGKKPLDASEMVQIQMYSRRDWFGRQKLPLHMHMH